MKKLLPGVLAALSLCCPMIVNAAMGPEGGDCYSRSHTEQWRAAASGRQLIVIIDQTVVLPDALQHSVWNEVANFIQPGDDVKLYTFSAVVPGQYMRLAADSYLDAPPSASVRGDIPMDNLNDLDSCLNQQKSQFTMQWGRQLVLAMQESRADIPKSEILHSLKSIGQDLKASPAKHRIILLVSDMLENSDSASFYRHNQIHQLNVKNILANVRHQQLVADLLGANIYVLGAGLLSPSDSHYISGKTLDSLESFWGQWFSLSNGRLVAFGTPALNQALQ